MKEVHRGSEDTIRAKDRIEIEAIALLDSDILTLWVWRHPFELGLVSVNISGHLSTRLLGLKVLLLLNSVLWMCSKRVSRVHG